MHICALLRVAFNNAIALSSPAHHFSLQIDVFGADPFNPHLDINTFRAFAVNAGNGNGDTNNLVFGTDGNGAYMQQAMARNLVIDFAQITNNIQSTNYVDGSQGWAINKSGGAQFNNAIFRGHIEASSGTFKGTLEAQNFIGDIAVARRYDDMTFRRNNTVTRNGAYQNRGYGMTIVLSCTLIYQLLGAGNASQSYYVDITFNIGGQEVTRRFFANGNMSTPGNYAQEFRFAANLVADYNNVSFFVRASGRDTTWDYQCSIENITATACRTNSNSFS